MTVDNPGPRCEPTPGAPEKRAVRAAAPGAVSVQSGEIVTLTNVPLGSAGRRK